MLMTHRDLVRNVVTWAREQGGLHSQVLPDHEIVPVAGVSLVPGYRLTSTDWTGWAYAAFVASALGCFGALAAERVSVAASGTVIAIGFAATALFAAVSYWMWRRALRRVTILVFDTAAPIETAVLSEASIVAQRDGRTADLWVVGANGFTDEALALAASNRTRCLVAGRKGFVEVSRRGPGRRPEPPSSAHRRRTSARAPR